METKIKVFRSKNFIWEENACLGQGAWGTVFSGLCINSGKKVAIKTFKKMTTPTEYRQLIQEQEILQKLEHKNIIKIIAQEEELGRKIPIIVMELCVGGSLLDFLQQPKNCFGLNEEEVCLILNHITEGIKCLRSKHIVHRDIKPGNILKFINNSGQSIYKLSDFGTAKEMTPDDKFYSVCGTPEYIHPDLFKNYHKHSTYPQSFFQSSDLWSIGITIYHIVTGLTPFQPWDKKNISKFLEIATKRPPGMISGIEKSENSPIEWSSELPKTVQLSQGFQNLITPLIVRMLEFGSTAYITFDDYFHEIDNILSKKHFDVFFCYSGSFVRILLDENNNFDEFQEVIQIQTNIEPSGQFFFFNSEIVSRNTILPKTTKKNPIILWSASSDPPENALILPKFYDENENGKENIKIAYQYKRAINELHLQQTLLQDTNKNIHYFLQQQFDKNKLLSNLYQFWQSNFKAFEEMIGLFSPYIDLKEHIDKLKENCNKNFEMLNCLKSLKIKSIEESCLTDPCENDCEKHFSIIIKDMEEIYSLSKKEHLSEVNKVNFKRFNQNTKEIYERYHNICLSKYKSMKEQFKDWHKSVYSCVCDVLNINTSTTTIHSSIVSEIKSLLKSLDEYGGNLKELVSKITDDEVSSQVLFSIAVNESSKKLSKTVKKELKENLKKIMELLKSALTILTEDEMILEEFSTISSLPSSGYSSSISEDRSIE